MNQYVIPANIKLKGGVLKVEQQLTAKVADGIYIAGTIDRIEGDCIVDFKHVSSKPNESCIPYNYKLQLLTYAYGARQAGYEINRIRIVYGVKPTKTIPARCIIVTEQIDFPMEELIKKHLELICDSISFVTKYPEKAYLITKDLELKQR